MEKKGSLVRTSTQRSRRRPLRAWGRSIARRKEKCICKNRVGLFVGRGARDAAQGRGPKHTCRPVYREP